MNLVSKIKDGLKVIYVGDDINYFAHLKSKINYSYAKLTPEYFQIKIPLAIEIQSLIFKIIPLSPNIVFFDISKYPKEMLHLIRVYQRLNLITKSLNICLIDNRLENYWTEECILSGINCVHIKSGEIHDVIYSAISIFDNNEVHEHEFIKTKLKEQGDFQFSLLSKISRINQDTIAFESNVILKDQQILSLNNYWTKSNIFKTNKVQIKKVDTQNHYYQFKYFYEAIPLFSEPLDESEEYFESENYERDLDKRNKEIEINQKTFYKWLNTNTILHSPKYVKVLIVDRLLNLYQSKTQTDKFQYVFRVQPDLDNPIEQLKNIFPQLIVFNCEHDETNESLGPIVDYTSLKENTLNQINFIIQELQKIENFHPFIIIFNTKKNSKVLATAMKYDLIMSTPKEYSFELLLQFAKNLEQKFKIPTDHILKSEIIIAKENEISIGELPIDIIIESISESDISFYSKSPLELFSVIKCFSPFPFYITIVPKKKNTNKDLYFGVIHGLAEVNKQKLRQKINLIIFHDLEEAKKKEKEEFQKLNQEVQKSLKK